MPATEPAGSGKLVTDGAHGKPFILDLADNPHPRMLGEALLARQIRFDSTEAMAFWHGYLAAMCGATGCGPDEIQHWMDRHERTTDTRETSVVIRDASR